MGMLDKFRRGGGGFLNGVDATITGLEFTTEADFKGDGKSATRKDGTSALWAKLTVRKDGAEEEESTHAQVAFDGEDFVIGEDLMSITPVGDAGLYADEPFLQLYSSYVENGGDDVDPDEDGTFHFDHLVGQRVRFIQVKDDKQQTRLAEAWKKNKSNVRKNYNPEGQKKGKDGKYYDVKVLVVSQVYGPVEETVTAAPIKTTRGQSTSRTNGSGKTTTTPPRASKPVPVPEPADYTTENDTQPVLLAVLAKEKGNKISKRSLATAITRYLPSDPDRREFVRRDAYDDNTLASFVEAGLITYAKGAKDQIITLA